MEQTLVVCSVGGQRFVTSRFVLKISLSHGLRPTLAIQVAEHRQNCAFFPCEDHLEYKIPQTRTLCPHGQTGRISQT